MVISAFRWPLTYPTPSVLSTLHGTFFDWEPERPAGGAKRWRRESFERHFYLKAAKMFKSHALEFETKNLWKWIHDHRNTISILFNIVCELVPAAWYYLVMVTLCCWIMQILLGHTQKHSGKLVNFTKLCFCWNTFWCWGHRLIVERLVGKETIKLFCFTIYFSEFIAWINDCIPTCNNSI